ncbi:arsenic resistance N-acetyltransferase ArsN2 [Pseudomonas umsongensis]|uniref:arsenic resistance N-acetyltransferase ArsN2 n=1 Tax=Pseudomonas umsongensis TaxID=198618 RepID=UPI00037A201A|nr:arsenic resistance N-acetyltransferase ArsN2 [Pseudomonas umsongensis]
MSDQIEIQVRQLTSVEIPELSIFLSEARLPTEDLTLPDRVLYRFEQDAELLGFGGIEGAGPDRLLRSLIVLDRLRGRGNGRRLLAMLEQLALTDGVQRLHLLTNTASVFFDANGYRTVPRIEAPETISRSAEFTSLCPASAVYMVKDLEPFIG